MFWRCDPNTGAPSKSSKMQYCDERCRCVPDCSDLIYIGVDSQCIGAAIGAGVGGISGREEGGEGREAEIGGDGEEENESVVDEDGTVKVRPIEDDDTDHVKTVNDDDDDNDDDDTTELETLNHKTTANITATTSTPHTLQPASNTTFHGVFKSFRLECGNTFLNEMCPKAPESYACDETTGKPTYQRKLQICQKNCRCVNACLDGVPAALAPKACLGGLGVGSGSVRVRESGNEIEDEV